MPRYGLMSDTHGHSLTAQRAVAVLLRHKIDAILHMGDVGNEAVIDALVVNNPKTGEQMDARVVFGNTDFDATDLGRHAVSVGVKNHHPVGRLDTPRGTLVFMHGDDNNAFDEALAKNAAYLCHGHTHLYAKNRVGKTLVINPGALYRASQYTVAVLDTEDESVTFYQVSRE